MAAALTFVFLILGARSDITCSDSYTCYEDTDRDVVWVKTDHTVLSFEPCKDVCENALIDTQGVYHSCDPTQPTLNRSAFEPIANAMGFSCGPASCGWDLDGSIWVSSSDTDFTKTCYFPADSVETWSCTSVPGNANCFGERNSLVCPCKAKPLYEACEANWATPPNYPTKNDADWGTDEDDTSCLGRINYWRRRACDEGWVECPAAGLPPMTECVCCHECGNSQAQYDSINGGHSSWTRCAGNNAQGVGGGATCAAVIDAFISERAEDSEGVMRCQGHCGPIVSSGCTTFFWGRSLESNLYTLDWGTCPQSKCEEYCENPTSNECYASPAPIAPVTCGYTDAPTPASSAWHTPVHGVLALCFGFALMK